MLQFINSVSVPLKMKSILMCSDEGPLIVSEFLQSGQELNGRFEIM